MAKIEVYTKDYCPYCTKAKELLKKKGVEFTEYDVTYDVKKQDEMKKRADGRKTVPQIFIDDEGIGGCDELYALDQQGKLDEKLGQAA